MASSRFPVPKQVTGISDLFYVYLSCQVCSHRTPACHLLPHDPFHQCRVTPNCTKTDPPDPFLRIPAPPGGFQFLTQRLFGVRYGNGNHVPVPVAGRQPGPSVHDDLSRRQVVSCSLIIPVPDTDQRSAKPVHQSLSPLLPRLHAVDLISLFDDPTVTTLAKAAKTQAAKGKIWEKAQLKYGGSK